MSSPKPKSPIDVESWLASHPSSSDVVFHYPFLVDFRVVIPGRGVFFNSQQHVYECLVAKGWDSLCNIPTPCFPDLVRKFYAQAHIPVLETKTIFSRVKSCPVSISVKDIALIFNLRRETASQFPMPINVLRSKFSLIVQALRGRQGYGIMDLKYNDLTDEYRFLYEITIANLLPSTRSHDIPVSLASFMYSVMCGSNLDLATIIWNGIADGIKSVGFSDSPLPYGSLISHILFKQQVAISYDEESSRPVEPIGSVKMMYNDMSDCHSCGDIGLCLSFLSKDIDRGFNNVLSRLDKIESLHRPLGAPRSPSSNQVVRYPKLANGGFLSYEEEEEIERERADD